MLIDNRKSADLSPAQVQGDSFCSTPEITDLLSNQSRSETETLRLLQAVVDNETAYWGLPYSLTVKATPMAESELSGYLGKKKQVLINESKLAELSDPTLLYAVLTQVYHSVQFARIQAYQQVAPDLREARFFRYEQVWYYEICHYQEDARQDCSFTNEAEEYAIYRAAEYLYEADHGEYRSA